MKLHGASVREIEGKGRGLIADRDLEPGTLILQEEPYAAMMNAEYSETRSLHTFQLCSKPLTCQGCKFACYSNKAEQKADWKNGHREECKAIQATRSSSLQNKLGAIDVTDCGPIMMGSRILWRRERERKAGIDTGQYGIDDLMDHWNTCGPEMKNVWMSTATLTKDFLNLGSKQLHSLDINDIAHVIAKPACNGWTILHDDQGIGQGLYITASFLNHSSNRNCEETYDGKTFLLRALRPIKKGQECTVTYRDMSETRFEMRAKLLQLYYFDSCSPKELLNLRTMKPFTRQDTVLGFAVHSRVWRECPWELEERDFYLHEILPNRKNGLADPMICQTHIGPMPSERRPLEIEAWGPAFFFGTEPFWQKIMEVIVLFCLTQNKQVHYSDPRTGLKNHLEEAESLERATDKV